MLARYARRAKSGRLPAISQQQHRPNTQHAGVSGPSAPAVSKRSFSLSSRAALAAVAHAQLVPKARSRCAARKRSSSSCAPENSHANRTCLSRHRQHARRSQAASSPSRGPRLARSPSRFSAKRSSTPRSRATRAADHPAGMTFSIQHSAPGTRCLRCASSNQRPSRHPSGTRCTALAQASSIAAALLISRRSPSRSTHRSCCLATGPRYYPVAAAANFQRRASRQRAIGPAGALHSPSSLPAALQHRLSASDTTSKRVRCIGHSASNIRAQHALPPALARTARIAPSARADSPSPYQVRRARANAAPATSMLTHQQVGNAATTARTVQRASATPAAPLCGTQPAPATPAAPQHISSARCAAHDRTATPAAPTNTPAGRKRRSSSRSSSDAAASPHRQLHRRAPPAKVRRAARASAAAPPLSSAVAHQHCTAALHSTVKFAISRLYRNT